MTLPLDALPGVCDRCGGYGEHFDYCPDSSVHQPRERGVPCQQCRRETWNHDAICTRCHGGPR